MEPNLNLPWKLKRSEVVDEDPETVVADYYDLVDSEGNGICTFYAVNGDERRIASIKHILACCNAAPKPVEYVEEA